MTAPEKPALADEMRTQNTTREVCGLCHRIHPIGFHVPGEIWEAAVHPRYRDTIHCLSCFIERADEKLLPWDEHIQFWPVSLRTHLNVDALADRVEALVKAVREPVRWFAEQMERKLRENDHKSHWRGESVLDLWPLMRKELDELNTAFAKNLPPERIVEECADVANYLMMLADNVARAALDIAQGEHNE